MHRVIIAVWLTMYCTAAAAQTKELWHNVERTMHYQPQGKDFVLYKGTQRFNRALYGTNTAFRVEAGDLPEFALYLPGMGGNCKIGIVAGGKSKWITAADHITTIYRPGSMVYEIKDSLLGNGMLRITVLAMTDAEGMIIKMEASNAGNELQLLVAYGGATGKKFSRDGDIGADPESSFYLQPAYCRDNDFLINKNIFKLSFGATKNDTATQKLLTGIFPANALLRVADAAQQQSPAALAASTANSATPLITAVVAVQPGEPTYFSIQNSNSEANAAALPQQFAQAETARQTLADRVILQTPDEYINPLGGALAIAADGIWEAPTYLHGAVAWRMRLPAWRGPYVADPLGWHDRARTHFSSYALSQVQHIEPGPVVMDTALHLARGQEKMGTALFSNGYIARNPNGDLRPHHYDMNLVYIDGLLNHFNYTGDTAYVKKMWPLVQLHLAWEKRNFDADGDGLYDAYACIWASDALEYSGGGVTHASAYNYRANTTAAQLAQLIGEDAAPYQQEAGKILAAMNKNLWLSTTGCFAENKDLLGLQLVHPAVALWTVYHAIDEGVADAFQQYQLLRYVDHAIPHIPVHAMGLKDSSYYLLATTNWQPYTWSINNVALAENLHAALAYWQAGENNNAFQLWKSALLESMYMSASPGGFEQLSFYDAMRGELYRDFADPIGVAARTLTEGLFGIHPAALQDSLLIAPGFPSGWKFAKIALPDISMDFKQNNNETGYVIEQHYTKQLNLRLQVKALKDSVAAVLVNGAPAAFYWKQAIGSPLLCIDAGKQNNYVIKIYWAGKEIEKIKAAPAYVEGAANTVTSALAKPVKLYDPQNILSASQLKNKAVYFTTAPSTANPSFFIDMQQGNASWTAALCFTNINSVEIKELKHEGNAVGVFISNNSSAAISGSLFINGQLQKQIAIPKAHGAGLALKYQYLAIGANKIELRLADGRTFTKIISNWDIVPAKPLKYEPINLAPYFNDNINNIFKNKYLAPRPAATTLQLPWQGIGNWCYPLVDAVINDSGARAAAKNNILYCKSIPFAYAAAQQNNIAFTSQWNNFPAQVTVPLSGSASHVYLLLAGTTNHQQSQLTNAVIKVHYTDGSTDSLPLVNPQNWWPIEQDLVNDGYAFTTGAARPYRLLLKSGVFTNDTIPYTSIKGFTNTAIDGGAATVLDLPLQKNKTLKSISLQTIANEVVAGLLSATLVR